MKYSKTGEVMHYQDSLENKNEEGIPSTVEELNASGGWLECDKRKY